jgi:hypothetical protein
MYTATIMTTMTTNCLITLTYIVYFCFGHFTNVDGVYVRLELNPVWTVSRRHHGNVAMVNPWKSPIHRGFNGITNHRTNGHMRIYSNIHVYEVYMFMKIMKSCPTMAAS